MKYFLLTFNKDHGDEFNVPALVCFTETEYQEWLKKPSGIVNENYEVQLEELNTKQKQYDDFVKVLQEKNLYNKPKKEFTSEETNWYNENKVDYISSYNRPHKLKQSFMNAYLGNYGECFEESYMDMVDMQEFVDANIVKVYEVDENFYNTFNKVKLNNLSLCNIFEIDN